MQDARGWYEDDEIRVLLEKEFSGQKDVELLTPMLGTPWSQGKKENRTFRDSLNQFILETKNLKNKKVVAPVNLGTKKGEGIHWVLLYFTLDNNAQLETVFYVDPFGKPIDPEIRKDLKEVFPRLANPANSINISEVKLQADGHNCGPWVVEIAKSLVRAGTLPAENFNIENARKAHAKVIKKSSVGAKFDTSSKPKSSDFTLHKSHKERFTKEKIKEALDEVFKDKSISYDEKSERVKARIEGDGKVFNFEQKEKFCELNTLNNTPEALILMVERTAAILIELGLPPKIEINAPSEKIKKILLDACKLFNLEEKLPSSQFTASL